MDERTGDEYGVGNGNGERGGLALWARMGYTTADIRNNMWAMMWDDRFHDVGQRLGVDINPSDSPAASGRQAGIKSG